MERKKSIDPIIRAQEEKEEKKIAEEAAKKARALMERPDNSLMEVPDHQLTEVERNPDRSAEDRAAEAWLDPDLQTWTRRGDEVGAKRAIGDEKKRRKYAKENGKNPDTFYGPMFRGTTDQLVGDSRTSVFTKFEDYMMKSTAEEAIESSKKAGEEFINKLPHGTPIPSPEEQRAMREKPGGLFGDAKPADDSGEIFDWEKHDAA